MEYLQRLESCLRWRVSRAELDDIMRDYAEYFEEGRRQNQSDGEISARLGEPELVARQIVEEGREQRREEQQPQRSRFGGIPELWQSWQQRRRERRSRREARRRETRPAIPHTGETGGLMMRFLRWSMRFCKRVVFWLVAVPVLLMILGALAVLALGMLCIFLLVLAGGGLLLAVGIAGLVCVGVGMMVLPLSASFCLLFGSFAAMALGVCLFAVGLLAIQKTFLGFVSGLRSVMGDSRSGWDGEQPEMREVEQDA